MVRSADIEVVALSADLDADRRFQEETFDVILIGACGRVENGVELARKIRESGLNEKTPIIMISDGRRLSTLREAFEVGVGFVMFKPLDKVRLMKLLHVTQNLIAQERRRFRRVSMKTEAQIKSYRSELAGETIDISMNRTLVRTSRTLPLGSAVEVSFYFHSEIERIVGLGSVVRIVNETQMGISLDRFSSSDQARLQECLLPLISD